MSDEINRRLVEQSIYLIRNLKVMLDEDLARLYGTETGALVRAVQRNLERFPQDFMFQLSEQEVSSLRCQLGISKPGRGGRRYLPYVFTEQGISMLSGVLNSPRAIAVNIEIMRACVRLRSLIESHGELAEKLNQLERRYDQQFKIVFDAIREIMTPTQPPKKRRIGFGTNEDAQHSNCHLPVVKFSPSSYRRDTKGYRDSNIDTFIDLSLLKPDHTMHHINPNTEELSEIEETPLDRIPQIVATTRQAQTAWGPLSVAERATILRAHSNAIETRRDALREAITQDMGKPSRNSDMEVSRCISAAEFLIDHAQEWLQPEPRDCGMIYFDPMGLGAAITPWNAPLVIPMFQILPSLLAGNAVVWKPSEFAPKTAQLYFDALTDFLPDNVVSVVVGGKDRGQALVEENFEFLTFTGSTGTGRYIAERSARNFTRLQLELGGVDAALVLDDVDPVTAAEAIVKINASNTGQICCSIKRVYVEASVYSDFVQAAAEASKRITVGDPREDVVMGPLASQMQLDKCQDFLNEALQQGAVLQSGGSRLSRPGYFFPHTVLSDLNPNTRLLREEAFGPLLPILSVASAEEAVHLANSLPMALTASVWGKDSPRSKKIVSQLAGGVVGLNRHGVPPVGCPWGGAKHSGMGRARSVEGMRECCNMKFVY